MWDTDQSMTTSAAQFMSVMKIYRIRRYIDCCVGGPQLRKEKFTKCHAAVKVCLRIGNTDL